MEKLQVKKGEVPRCGAGCDFCVDEDRLEAWAAVAKQSRATCKPRLQVPPIDRAAVALARQESQFEE